MIKLIASDLDGTLLQEGTADIHPEIYEVIRALQEAGVRFVAASGRNYESVMSIFGCMEKEILMISDNGGYSVSGGQELYCCGFSKLLLKKILDAARKIPDVWMMASAARCVYTDQNDPTYVNWIREGYKSDISIVADLLEIDEPLIKVALYSYKRDAAVVAEELREQLGEEVEIVLSGERWIDMVMPNVSKGQALARIQEMLGISKAETAAFGDNGNDIPMLLQAEESYAVANAREETKAVAKYVIGDVSEHAVLTALKQILAEI